MCNLNFDFINLFNLFQLIFFKLLNFEIKLIKNNFITYYYMSQFKTNRLSNDDNKPKTTYQDKLTPKETSKGAEEIVLTQIKQDFITPANAIFDYVDMVEKILTEADLDSEDEIEQIKITNSIHNIKIQRKYHFSHNLDRMLNPTVLAPSLLIQLCL